MQKNIKNYKNGQTIQEENEEYIAKQDEQNQSSNLEKTQVLSTISNLEETQIVNEVPTIEQTQVVENIPDIFFNQLEEKLKIYFIIGGMPEAVGSWVLEKDIEKVNQIQQNILRAYEADFSKHTSNVEANRISIIWNSIPSQLSRDNKKFLYQVAKEGARAREYEGALNWLNDANLLYKIYNVKKTNLPLCAYRDLSSFKIYLNDIGLLRRMTNLDSKVIIEKNRIFEEFKGALTENYVLQMLLAIGLDCNYFTFDNRYEIDYIIQYQNEILPIEVKAGENVRNISLKTYQEKYKPTKGIRISMKNLQKDGQLINIPLFMIEYIKKFIEE